MSSHWDFQINYIFNHDFSYPGPTGEFPSGWQKSKGGKSSSIDWEPDHDFCDIRIRNKSRQLASICQQRPYSVPVYKDQVWKVGVRFRSEKKLNAIIIIHFIPSSSRLLQTTMDFMLEPESEFYSGTTTIPAGVDFAYLEIGLKEPGTIWVEDVVFVRVFPIGEYSADARGRLNINSVERVKNIVDPVIVQRILEPTAVHGKVETVQQSRDSFEDLIAGPIQATSNVQDVLILNTYSFCVLNLGPHSAQVYIQISPDAIHWIDEPPVDNNIAPGNSKVLVGNYFLRYIRVVYMTAGDESTNLRIFFQAQG